MTDDPVLRQYESFPYPPRQPADERRRLISGSPSHLLEVCHYVFGGRRDPERPLRILVAGGGTGDAAIMIAQQLHDAAWPGEVLYVDVSAAARAIAEARAEVRGLANIRFATLSLLDLPDSGLGPFDYIDCCGVLHHLPDPAAGLAALTRLLADDGGIGLMVYGEFGRTGVYPVQAMMRLIAADDADRERLDLLKRLLAGLPETNWLRRNPFLGDHLSQGDEGLFDLFLHARDRVYRVPEVAALVEACGLRIVSFIEPTLYDPSHYVHDGRLTARVERLTALERAAFAEFLAGNMRKHVLYVVKAGNPVAPLQPSDPDAVPVLRDIDAAGLAQQLAKGGALTADIDGLALRMPLPARAAAIVRRIDGRRSLAEIYRSLAEEDQRLTPAAFYADFAGLFAALNGLGKLYLLQAPA